MIQCYGRGFATSSLQHIGAGNLPVCFVITQLLPPYAGAPMWSAFPGQPFGTLVHVVITQTQCTNTGALMWGVLVV